uniref:GRIP domain-containing protein n=1 Tax=Photinus pyralis TaxID=7054 RepID=A0A1Y1K9N7_PHOPY
MEQNEKLEVQQKLTESVKTSHTIHSQCDKLQDEVDENKNKVKDLLKKLDSAALDISNSKKQLAENEEIINKLRLDIETLTKEKANTDTWKKQIGTKVQSLRKELDANNLLKKDFENQILKLNQQLEEKDKLLKAEIEKHHTTRHSLHESNNECKKQTVLNLEMQDYERSLKDLNQKLEKNKELVNKYKSQVDSQKGTVNTLKEEYKNLEERLQMGEQDLNVAQREVQAYKKSIGDLEGTITQKENKIQGLVEALEATRLENENLASQLSKIMAEDQKAHDSLKAERDYLRGQNLGLEEKWRDLSETLRLRENELSEMSREYQGYKVRAQSVLRQNQTRDIGLEEKLTEEVVGFKSQIGTLTSELTDLRNQYQSVSEEREKVNAENESLTNQQKALEEALKERENQFEALTADHQRAIAEHAEAIRGLKIHAETLAQCYRQQLSEQEVRHNREVIELQSKLDKGSTLPDVSPVTLPMIPREQGEGSENVEPSFAHPIPLNRLLSSESDHEVDFLKKQAVDNDAKIVHLTALLADTEQDLAKHVQMNKLLKDEIRRQQRSVEREKHADNLEYLKNVVFKFATLSSGDERSRLVPVLNTILKFSPEEIHKLNLVARSDFGNRGWTNYLPIWPNKPQ